MAAGNIGRLRNLMRAEELDAVIAFTSENFRWASGYQPAALILKATGAFMTLIPADEQQDTAMIVSAFDVQWARERADITEVRAIDLWVEIDELAVAEAGAGEVRPKEVQFSWDQVFAFQREVLGDRGLLNRRIGCELEALPAGFRRRLEAEFPDVTWVDVADLFQEARMIKLPHEVDLLRKSVEMAEFGMRTVMLDNDPRGKSVSQLRAQFEIAVMQSLLDDPGLGGYESCRIYMTAGGTIGPNTVRNDRIVKDGDIVWIDTGIRFEGYEADIGRTFQVGKPTELTERIAGALAAGSEAGFELLTGPGVIHSAVYNATQAAVRANGLPWYTRGHFGHGLGVGGGEQHPFIEEAEDRPFEVGMCFAYERPYYVRGLGGFQNEDNFVVTESGMERFGSMPQGLIRV